MFNIRHFFNGLQIVPRSDGATAPTTQGDLAVSNVDGNLYYNNGTSSEIISSGTNQIVLTSKTIAVGNNHITSTPNTAAQFNATTGDLESSVTNDTELSYVHGVTSPIQTQLNAITAAAIDGLTGDVTATGPGTVNASLTATTNSTITTLSVLSLPGSQVTGSIPGNSQNVNGVVAITNGGTGQTTANTAYGALSPMTTIGDIEYESAPGVASRLPIGITNQLLSVSSGGIPSWSTFTALTNPMTSTGDLIYSSDNLGTPTRLPIGTTGQVLEVSSGIPTWVTPPSSVPSGVISSYAGNTKSTVVFTSSSSTTTFTNAISTSYYIGQGFTPTSTGAISSATVSLSWVGGSQPTGSMNVQIYTNASGVPGTLLCASVAQNASIITNTPTPITFTITGGSTLTSGTEYFLVWEPFGVTFNSSTIQVNTDNTNPYPGGTAVISLNGGTSYTPNTGSDLQFSVSGVVTTTPSGYLFCDGSSYLISAFPTLAAALFDATTGNYSYGSPDAGATLFNVPQLQGYFLRGVDNGSGNDPDTLTRTALQANGNTGDNIGSVQADAEQDHTHNEHWVSGGSGQGIQTVTGSNPVASTVNTGPVQSANASTETRPKNVYVNYIIKT